MVDDNTPLNREILFYATPSGAVRVEVVFEEETFWLSQKKMAELFGVEATPSPTTSKKSTSPVNSRTWQLLEKFE